jgi:hypothetical protein
MTPQQRAKLLAQLEIKLKRTTRGYSPNGVNWRSAMEILDQLQEDASPAVKIPELGPIVKGGVSILLQDCTHITSGLGWPAFDDGWVAGKEVIAPEDCYVDDDTSSASGGGDAFYVKGESKIRYYIAHITTVPKLDTKFKKGATMTRISPEHIRDHVHLGLDTRPLIGKFLISHDDYTHGAPKIGVQLRKALA